MYSQVFFLLAVQLGLCYLGYYCCCCYGCFFLQSDGDGVGVIWNGNESENEEEMERSTLEGTDNIREDIHKVEEMDNNESEVAVVDDKVNNGEDKQDVKDVNERVM